MDLEKLRVAAAFAVVYLVWGSTYLAIRLGVAELPPALLAGVRFVIAGVLLAVLGRVLGQQIPRGAHAWSMCIVTAVSLVLLGNGLVTWAEQWLPSNQAALIVSSSALWTAWFGTFGPRAAPLGPRSRLGLALGFAGVALLLWPGRQGSGTLLIPQLAILFSALSWSAGAIVARSYPVAMPPLMFSAWQMLIGGALLVAVGLMAGEHTRWSWAPGGLAALLYLTLFGSCLAYTTYLWLIHRTTPDRLATIAYVNPAVATVLGWWLLDEALNSRQLAGMIVILLAVVLVTLRRRVHPGRP